jgi:hypothetical protein
MTTLNELIDELQVFVNDHPEAGTMKVVVAGCEEYENEDSSWVWTPKDREISGPVLDQDEMGEAVYVRLV